LTVFDGSVTAWSVPAFTVGAVFEGAGVVALPGALGDPIAGAVHRGHRP